MLSDKPLCCRWHEYNWLACRYCATHLENQIPKCDPSEPCTICDQASLFDEAGAIIVGDESGAVTVGRVVVILLATIGALITIPIVLLILIVLLGAPA